MSTPGLVKVGMLFKLQSTHGQLYKSCTVNLKSKVANLIIVLNLSLILHIKSLNFICPASSMPCNILLQSAPLGRRRCWSADAADTRHPYPLPPTSFSSPRPAPSAAAAAAVTRRRRRQQRESVPLRRRAQSRRRYWPGSRQWPHLEAGIYIHSCLPYC